MAKQKGSPRAKRGGGASPILLIVGVGLIALAIVAGVWFLLAPSQNAGGTPEFQVNTDRIDFGKQILGNTVHAEFIVKNIGKGALMLTVPRAATLVDGC